MVAVTGVGGVRRRLQQLATKGQKAIVEVSFTAEYAIFVHEDLAANHTVGQAKYLEQPAREMRGYLVNMIKNDLASGASLADALFKAGLLLQAAAQKLVPIDTGVLRASGTTTIRTG